LDKTILGNFKVLNLFFIKRLSQWLERLERLKNEGFFPENLLDWLEIHPPFHQRILNASYN